MVTMPNLTVLINPVRYYGNVNYPPADIQSRGDVTDIPESVSTRNVKRLMQTDRERQEV